MEWPRVVENDDGIRPAGEPDRCFYCHQKIGQAHKLDCAVVTKRMRVRLTIEIEINRPHWWGKEQVEFQVNDGTYCADNMIGEIQEFADVLEKKGACLCQYLHLEYLDDADTTPRREIRNHLTNQQSSEGEG